MKITLLESWFDIFIYKSINFDFPRKPISNMTIKQVLEKNIPTNNII